MLIPSIDLQQGRVVQLVQGERLALSSDDLDAWIDRFRPFPVVQVVDLDAAMGTGSNEVLVRRVCRELPCQVGGGVRSGGRARSLLEAGARRVVVGSAFFTSTGVDLDAARAFADAVDREAIVAAVDARGGCVAVHGWKTLLPLTPVEAVVALAPYVGGFLYTHIDTEGTLTGLDLDAALEVRRATDRAVIAAGGIRSLTEIERLERLGIDAVVGMAVYTGAIDLAEAARRAGRPGNTKPGPSV